MVYPRSIHESRCRMTRTRRALAVPLAALLALAPAGVAHAAEIVASEGSVPSEVQTYVGDGSLVAQLNDVYGVNATGSGIDFDDTTKPGVVERVHVWSDEFRAGEETDHLVDILNEWIVPISIAEEPVGLATVWINPATVAPELASFVADADLATALSTVPDGSSLVRDDESRAWFALAADGMLTPLLPGTTGLSTPVPVEDVAILPADPGTPAATGDLNPGVGFAIAVLVLLFAIIVVALVLPGMRARRKKPAEEAMPVAEPEVSTPAVIEAAPVRAQLEAMKPAAPTKPVAPKKPAAAKKTATTKPAAAKKPAAKTAAKATPRPATKKSAEPPVADE